MQRPASTLLWKLEEPALGGGWRRRMESRGKEIRGWPRGEGADTLGNLYNYPQRGGG